MPQNYTLTADNFPPVQLTKNVQKMFNYRVYTIAI